MRKLILIAITFSCFQLSFAKSLSLPSCVGQPTNRGFIIYQPQPLTTIATTQIPKKRTIKGKFLASLFFKLTSQSSQDADKKRNKRKAIISALAGGLSIFLFILTLILADGFAALGGVVLSIIAIVMGLKALKRSKTFDDDTNSGRSAALTGIVLGCIGFAAFLLWTIIELSGMS